MNIAQNPNSELSHFAVNTPQVFEIPETFRETARQFQEAMMQYSCAIREFKTKLEVLNDEFQVQRSHNPISYIKYRVKKPASILEKLDKYSNIEDINKVLDVIRDLCAQDYSSENLKSGFLKWLEEYKTRALEGDPADMMAYIEIAKSCSNGIPYISVIDCFPYAEMKKYFESNGKKAIVSDGEGGYYDGRKEEFSDESYWYDPLSMERVSRGSVGTYQHKKEHLYFGDFMEARTTKYWYGSALGDSCNEYQTALYLQGEYVGNSNSLSMYVLEDESFPNNNVYYLTTPDDILVASVERARIIFIHANEMVAVEYE